MPRTDPVESQLGKRNPSFPFRGPGFLGRHRPLWAVDRNPAVIPLCDNVTTSNVTGSDGATPKPLGIKFIGLADLIGVVYVTSAPSGGTGGTNFLDIGFQSSCDNGQTSKNLGCLLRNPSSPYGGTPSLDVIFQHCCDDGQTWSDIAHPQVITAAQDYYFSLSIIAPGPTSVSPIVDGTSPVNTFVNGP